MVFTVFVPSQSTKTGTSIRDHIFWPVGEGPPPLANNPTLKIFETSIVVA